MPSLYEGLVIADKYRLDSELAQGGMGSVWVATNIALDKRVALKVLHAQLLANEQAGVRLKREARTAAQLVHPNIVQIFDVGELETGEPFIVMELLQGKDLFEKLEQQGPLAPTEAVSIMIRVAQGLSAAHAKGIVHRDLKPGNIVLARDDRGGIQPKIVDFGIAKATTQDLFEPKLTMEGRVLGSPEYLSPEQARGDSDIDARTDIWALCVSLYESVTGKPPFRGDNYHKLLRSIIEDEPSSIVELGHGDQALWEIIQRGLRKNKQDRWQTMDDLSLALTQWLEQSSPGLSASISGNSLFGIENEMTPAPLSLNTISNRGSKADILLAPPIPGPPVKPIPAISPATVPQESPRRSRVVPTAIAASLVLGGGLAIGFYLLFMVAASPKSPPRYRQRVTPSTIPPPPPASTASRQDIPAAPPPTVSAIPANSTNPAESDAGHPDAAASSSTPSPRRPSYRRFHRKHAPPIPLEPNF